MRTFLLRTPQETLHFGAGVARALLQLLGQLRLESFSSASQFFVPAILLHGELGAGKTTFARAFVHALPCGEEAEVASPSFTLCHHYDTQPPVLHGDLYRVQGYLPEEIAERFDDGRTIVLLEWADLLPIDQRPEGALDIRFEMCQDGRLAKVQVHGALAIRLLENLDNIIWTQT